MIIKYCDICRKEIKNTIKKIKGYEIGYGINKRGKHIDVCPDCIIIKIKKHGL